MGAEEHEAPGANVGEEGGAEVVPSAGKGRGQGAEVAAPS